MQIDRDGWLGTQVQRMATSSWFRKVGPRVVPQMDRIVHRVSKGRFTTSALLVPSLVLTVIGAKSGQPRVIPLACLPDDGSFYVVGSNFGQVAHPAWTTNLDANPDATVSYRGADHAVRAHRLDDDEKAEVWPKLLHIWPSYATYAEVSGRSLRVYRLDPAPA